MSEPAMIDKQLAVSSGPPHGGAFGVMTEPVLFTVDRLFLIAGCKVATCFTVTAPLTSVTHQGLAESVLIRVGKLDLERNSKASQRDAGRQYCSFREGTCIQ